MTKNFSLSPPESPRKAKVQQERKERHLLGQHRSSCSWGLGMSAEPKAPSQAGGACLKHHLWEAKGAGGMLSLKRGLSEAAAPGSSNPQLQVCDSRSTASSYCPVPGFASCQYSAPRARLGASAPVLLPRGSGKMAMKPLPTGLAPSSGWGKHLAPLAFQ